MACQAGVSQQYLPYGDPSSQFVCLIYTAGAGIEVVSNTGLICSIFKRLLS